MQPDDVAAWGDVLRDPLTLLAAIVVIILVSGLRGKWLFTWTVDRIIRQIIDDRDARIRELESHIVELKEDRDAWRGSSQTGTRIGEEAVTIARRQAPSQR